MLLLSVPLVTFISYVQSANILACVPTPSYSHQVAFYDLWIELSLRGHQVTLITTDPLRDPKLKNLTEIDISGTYAFVKRVSKLCESELNPWNYKTIERRGLRTIRHYQLTHPQIKNLIGGKGTFDVVLTEYAFPELLLFGKIYNCPTILLSSTDLDPIFHQVVGNPAHPVLHPDLHLPYHGRMMSFSQRFLSTVYYCYRWLDYYFHDIPFYEEGMKTYFNMSVQMHELLNDVNVAFFNSHPVIHGSRAYSPGAVFINHRRMSHTQRPLEKSVKEFMDKAKEGFIYFSLGSNVKSSQLDNALLATILEALEEQPYKVLFKYEADEVLNKPNNIKMVKWAPQTFILNHPNIKLFITQGGRQSTEEAVYASVPMVIVPFFFDQYQNAYMMESKGIAQVVERKPYLRKEELINAIIEVTGDARYKKAAKQLMSLALDLPMSGLEKAIWWTEYVIRHNHTRHLRNPVVDLPFYQYILLDVLGFFVLVLLCTSVLVYVIVVRLLNVFGHSKMKNEKLE